MARTRSIERGFACLAVGAVFCGVLDAAAPVNAQPAGARPIEPTVGDAGPLSVNTRVMPRDPRHPLGFDRLYSITRTDAFGSGEVFLRISGAVTAVFPRSSYINTPRGPIAEIPAGTRFHIGRLPDEYTPRAEAPPPSLLRSSLAMDLRAADPAPIGAAPLDTPPDARPPAGAPTVELASIWTSEEYRQVRIGQILAQARAKRKEKPSEP